jgi:4-hydroxybenzoyl-CoA reductase subunit gamma
MSQRVVLDVNGRSREELIDDHELLLDYLRERRGLTGTKRGCDGGECGACTVLLDGEPRLSCLTLAASCAGRAVETIESRRLLGGGDGDLSALQRAFHEKLGAQCGYCTPGMIMAAEALLRRRPQPGEAEIREALSGNLCRCTGYVKIVEAVEAAAAAPEVVPEVVP